MRAKHWIIGFVLGIAGIGGVSATSLDTQELDNGSHASSDSASTHDGGGSTGGGDALGLGHENPPRNSAGDTSVGSPNTHHDRAGAATATPAPVQQPHLGWQSLLPGSIQ